MTKPIRVRYAPSPTGLLHIGNARTALFNYLLPVITAVLSLFVSKTQTASAMWKTVSVLSLKTCVGWGLTGMRVQKLMSNTVSLSVWIFTKSMLISSWQKERSTSLT